MELTFARKGESFLRCIFRNDKVKKPENLLSFPREELLLSPRKRHFGIPGKWLDIERDTLIFVVVAAEKWHHFPSNLSSSALRKLMVIEKRLRLLGFHSDKKVRKGE